MTEARKTCIRTRSESECDPPELQPLRDYITALQHAHARLTLPKQEPQTTEPSQLDAGWLSWLSWWPKQPQTLQLNQAAQTVHDPESERSRIVPTHKPPT